MAQYSLFVLKVPLNANQPTIICQYYPCTALTLLVGWHEAHWRQIQWWHYSSLLHFDVKRVCNV